MKNWVLIFGAIVLFVSACQSNANTDGSETLSASSSDTHAPNAVTASQTENPTDAGETDGPTIAFDKIRYRFGEIWHAEKVTHEYTFTNTGTEPLIVKNVKVSCGCTKPTYSKLPIAPGESSAIKIVFNSVGKKGTQNASIRVFTNDAATPEVVLRLIGRVKVKPRAEYEKEQAAKN